jgi:hypothetical protein
MVCSNVGGTALDSTTKDYQAISNRNVFGLKPAPKVDPPAPVPAPLPKLILTGITTILGNKLVLMKALPPTNAPGPAAKEESLILTEGQRQGNVEVLSIDEKAGSVRVNNSGTVVTLTFEKDGAKLPSTPPPPVPGFPYPTNTNPLQPAALPTAAPPASPAETNPRRRPTPRRGVRSPDYQGATQTAVPAYPNPQVPAAAANPASPALPPSLTPEEQAIVLEMQRQAVSPPGSTSPVYQTTVPPVPAAPAPGAPGPVLPQ